MIDVGQTHSWLWLDIELKETCVHFAKKKSLNVTSKWFSGWSTAPVIFHVPARFDRGLSCAALNLSQTVIVSVSIKLGKAARILPCFRARQKVYTEAYLLRKIIFFGSTPVATRARGAHTVHKPKEYTVRGGSPHSTILVNVSLCFFDAHDCSAIMVECWRTFPPGPVYMAGSMGYLYKSDHVYLICTCLCWTKFTVGCHPPSPPPPRLACVVFFLIGHVSIFMMCVRGLDFSLGWL